MQNKNNTTLPAKSRFLFHYDLDRNGCITCSYIAISNANNGNRTVAPII